MSRNLASTSCYYCGDTPSLDEPPRQIKRADAGVYIEEYRGMLVANATCPSCGAQYLAWVKDPTPSFSKPLGRQPHDCGFFDLSFRSTFNQEPGPGDKPLYEVESFVVRRRVGPWLKDEYGSPLKS